MDIRKNLKACAIFVLASGVFTCIPLVVVNRPESGTAGSIISGIIFTFVLVSVFSIPVSIVWAFASRHFHRLSLPRPHLDIGLGAIVGVLVYLLLVRDPSVGLGTTITGILAFGFGFAVGAFGFRRVTRR